MRHKTKFLFFRLFDLDSLLREPHNECLNILADKFALRMEDDIAEGWTRTEPIIGGVLERYLKNVRTTTQRSIFSAPENK